MDLVPFFKIASFLFSAAAYIPYTIAVFKKKANPTISSWISWGLMDAVILAGMIAADKIAWQMVAYVIGVMIVIGANLWKGASIGWTLLDTICLSIVVCALVLWRLSGNATVVIAMSLVAIYVGTWPFLVNTWEDPSREPMLPWVITTIGGTFGLFAIEEWSIAGAATQVSFSILQFAGVWLVSRKFQTKASLT